MVTKRKCKEWVLHPFTASTPTSPWTQCSNLTQAHMQMLTLMPNVNGPLGLVHTVRVHVNSVGRRRGN